MQQLMLIKSMSVCVGRKRAERAMTLVDGKKANTLGHVSWHTLSCTLFVWIGTASAKASSFRSRLTSKCGKQTYGIRFSALLQKAIAIGYTDRKTDRQRRKERKGRKAKETEVIGLFGHWQEGRKSRV